MSFFDIAFVLMTTIAFILIIFGIVLPNKEKEINDRSFNIDYAKKFLESYDINPEVFMKKPYKEQLQIIKSAYVVNCDSGMAEYMVDADDEEDLQDTLDILEPLINHK